MKIKKYTAQGNSFIIVDEKVDKELVKNLCSIHFGIGADGLIYHDKTLSIPFMEFYNQDGSSANMCGNGIRCFAQYLYEINKFDEIKIDTKAGIKKILVDNTDIFTTTVNMGIVKELGEYIKKIDDKIFNCHLLNTGTEHVVIEIDYDMSVDDVKKYGSILENSIPLFKNGTNVNFIKKISDNKLLNMTWERGVGFSYSCGTGNVAAAYVTKCDKVEVYNIFNEYHTVKFLNNEAYLTGSTKKILEGEF